jgi:hypothetical protein
MSENKYKSDDIFVNSIPMYLEAVYWKKKKIRRRKEKGNAM